MEEKNTMLDYLSWRGDLTFNQDPFNEVDNLVLAQLSYVDFDGIVSPSRENPILIGDACSRYWERHTEEEIRNKTSFVNLSPYLLEPVAKSRRFGKMRLCGYVNTINKSAEAQFSAIQFELEDGTVYVAFRGTDETIIGWKEDFNLSFMSRTEGQRLAVEYMKKNFSNTSLKLRVGGHSKGGNFAVFASAFSGSRIINQIQKVYRNDAPGFRREITSKPEFKLIEKRTVTIIPEDSVIGRLLDAGKEAIVVRSSKKGIMQHDAMSWQIRGGRFSYTKRSSDSIRMEKVLSGWLENVDDEARRVFVDQIFNVMQTLGTDTMKDVREVSFGELTDAIQMIRGLSKEQQSEISKVVKKLVASGGRAFYEELEQKDGIIPDAIRKLSELKNKIGEARQAPDSSRHAAPSAKEKSREIADGTVAEPAKDPQ